MNTPKPPMGAGRLFFNHLILWPLVHILALVIFWPILLVTLAFQAGSFVWYLVKRSSYKAAIAQQQAELGTKQHKELMQAMADARSNQD